MWQSVEVSVDMDSKREALERVASEVVATIRLHPRWYGGDYRVWFAEALPGWKLKVGIYFNYSDKGAHQTVSLVQCCCAARAS